MLHIWLVCLLWGGRYGRCPGFFSLPVDMRCAARGCSGSSAAERLWDASSKDFTPKCVAAMTELFHRFDMDLDEVLSRAELNKFQQLTDGCDMGDEVR